MATNTITAPFGMLTEITGKYTTETDFNNLTKMGIWYCSNMTTNRPSESTYWYVFVIQHVDNGILRQFAFMANGRHCYTRYRNSNGVWNSWILMTTPVGADATVPVADWGGTDIGLLAQYLVNNSIIPTEYPFVARIVSSYVYHVDGLVYTSSGKKYGYMHVAFSNQHADVHIQGDTYSVTYSMRTGTLTAASGFTITEGYCRQSGKVVDVYFYGTKSSAFSIGTETHIVTWSGVDMPSYTIRQPVVTGSGVANLNHLAYMYSVASTGKVYIKTTAADIAIAVHFTYVRS